MATVQTFEAGKPGGFATKLAWRARLRTGAAAAIAAAAFWFAAGRIGGLDSGAATTSLPTVVAIVIGALAAAVARHFWGRAAAAHIGAVSERTVARVLRAQRSVALLHSVDLDAGGDADHLVAGPHLVVVETKTGGGKVVYDGGKLYVGSKALRGDPVAQCRRQALAAKRVFGTFCDAVVCVVDMSNAPFSVGSVHVCSASDLPAVLAGLPARLRPDQAWARAVELAPKCSTVHARTADDVPPVAPVPSTPARSLRPPTADRIGHPDTKGRTLAPHTTPVRKLRPRTDDRPN